MAERTYTIGKGHYTIHIIPNIDPKKIRDNELVFFPNFHIKYGNRNLEWWEGSDVFFGLVSSKQGYTVHALKQRTIFKNSFTIADGKIMVDILSQDQETFTLNFHSTT